jgi:hypothetical protein
MNTGGWELVVEDRRWRVKGLAQGARLQAQGMLVAGSWQLENDG